MRKVNQKLSAPKFLAKNNSEKPAQTSKMAQLLAKFEKFSLPKRGNKVEGKVSAVLKDRILVDFGGKSEGVIGGSEFSNLAKTDRLPQIGEKISAIVVYPEDEQGSTILSIVSTISELSWEKLQNLAKSAEAIEAKLTQLGKSGILVEILGLRGFIPAIFAESSILANFENFKGKRVKVKVLEVNKTTNRLICSTIFEQEKVDLAKKFKIGEKYSGTIAATLPFGLVVNFDSLSAFVPNPEVSWEKIDNPQNFFKVGENLDFVFLGVDKKTGRPSISVKLATPDPWAEISKKYSKDSQVKGTISKISDFGAFVSLENGVEGLVHISKIPPDLVLKIGDKITCTVESIDVNLRRISFSLVLKTKPIGYR